MVVGRIAPDEERLILLKPVVQFYFTYGVSRGFSIHLFVYSLFGGNSTKECEHNLYEIRLRYLKGKFRCNFEVFDQNVI